MKKINFLQIFFFHYIFLVIFLKEKNKLTYNEIIEKLKDNSDEKSLTGMAKVGITPEKAFGVKIPILRAIAKEIGYDSELAKKLWENDTRETRILACMIENPKVVTKNQMEEWVKVFDYWEICDQCCMNLFRKSQFAYEKSFEWSSRKEEYIKRAGFAIIAVIAAFDKNANDDKLREFLPIIKKEAIDERNMVKKAVNWALRSIGKRNLTLHKEALDIAEQIKNIDSKSARWIASDAIKELTSEAIIKRLQK